MLSTFTSYTLIAKDMSAALSRKAASPQIARDTAYFTAHIGQVTSVDAFLADKRLFAYAMKAFGLEDMTYAKAFMRKVLTEGVTRSSSFANRLADDRYVRFAKAFDFTRVVSANAATTNTAQVTGTANLLNTFDFSGTNEASFLITSQLDATTTKSAKIVLNKTTLASSVQDPSKVTAAELLNAINAQIAASGTDNLAGKVQAGFETGALLAFQTTAYADLGADGALGGTGINADTVYASGGANRSVSIRNVALSASGQTAVDLGFGTGLPPDQQAQSVTAAYLRQSLETDAGADDTGVRLALYFSRMGASAKSGYAILGDAALYQVVQTVLGLPAAGTSSDALARQAATIEKRVDLKSFSDPTKLDAFVKRFAAIWDAQNNTASNPVLSLFSDASDAGGSLDAAVLARVQTARAG